jgi:hypothetical protein
MTRTYTPLKAVKVSVSKSCIESLITDAREMVHEAPTLGLSHSHHRQDCNWRPS